MMGMTRTAVDRVDHLWQQKYDALKKQRDALLAVCKEMLMDERDVTKPYTPAEERAIAAIAEAEPKP